jgi:hypothetical protein
MADSSIEFLPEQQRLLIERIFNELGNCQNPTTDKSDDSVPMPGLCEFFNSISTLPSFEQIYA